MQVLLNWSIKLSVVYSICAHVFGPLTAERPAAPLQLSVHMAEVLTQRQFQWVGGWMHSQGLTAAPIFLNLVEAQLQST